MNSMDPSSDVVPDITCKDLFFAFFGVGISSFGGVLPWARRMLVERRRWLSEREFAEALGLGQVLPGPNVVNLSVMIGARFRGAKGALSAFSGLMFAPLLIVLSLAAFYTEYVDLPAVQRVFAGIAPAAAGLVVAMGLGMVRRQPRAIAPLATSALAFISAGVFRLPLLWVVLALAPLAIFLAWRRS